jgi:putative zinc finger/helix-turn-helix YgiT family protein
MSGPSRNGANRQCPVCGRGVLRKRFISETLQYAEEGDAVMVKTQDVPIEDCDVCGESFGPEAARIRHEAIGHALGLLQPQEIRILREGMGQSLDQFGNLIGVKSECLSQWENGIVWQDRTADLLMRLLARNPDNVQFLESLAPVSPEESANQSPGPQPRLPEKGRRRVISRQDAEKYGL